MNTTKHVDTTPFNFVLALSDGGTLDLGQARGRPLLVVNTATRCGLAPQFEALERLHRELGPRGLVVVGIPSNQFADQEPESDETMREVCRVNHGVTFPLTRKADVNGAGAHPLIAHLKARAPGFLGRGDLSWNFTKFLVWPDGRKVRRYAPTTPPDRIRADVLEILG